MHGWWLGGRWKLSARDEGEDCMDMRNPLISSGRVKCTERLGDRFG